MILILVIADILTKVFAYSFLPQNTYLLGLDDYLYIMVMVNETGFGTASREFFGNNQTLTFLIAIVNVLFAVAVYFFTKIKLNLFVKVILGFFVYIVLAVTAMLFSTVLDIPNMSTFVLSLFSRISSVAVVLILLVVSKSFHYQLAFSLVLAGGLGNLLSSFYPPFKVVDFMYFELFYKLFRTKLFNLADLYINIFYIVIICVIIYSVVLFFKNQYSKKSQDNTKLT